MTDDQSKKWFRIAQNGVTIILTVAGVVGAVYGVTAWIDYRVETLISDDKFAYKLSRNLRPFVIFDSNNSIVYDQGAMDYIESIEVDTTFEDGFLFVNKVTVSPKHFLETPPSLDCIDLKDHIYRPVRGKKFDWVYELTNKNVMGPTLIRFRLEILR